MKISMGAIVMISTVALSTFSAGASSVELQLGITTITFETQTAQYIRITQTGQNATYHWSIYELDVYRKNI
jgi:hypothetical protein